MYQPDIKGRRFFLISIFVLLGLLILPAISDAQAKNIEQDHVRFYRSGAVLNVSKVLAFHSFGKGSSIKEVTVRYNMIRSDLEADWIYNGRVIGHSLMPKGLKKSIRFTYNQPLPGTVTVRFTGAEGQVQVTNVSAMVIERGEGEVLIEESEVDKQQKYDLLSKLIKISLATKRKNFKLAYEIKDHLIRRIIEKNLIDEKTIQSNISENSTIKILADKNDVTLSGQIKSQQDEAIIIKNLKEAAQEVVDVKHVKTDIHVIFLPVYTLIPFVPNVIGMDVSEAEEIISKSGFVNKVASYTFYKREYQGQEGRVVSQSPEARKQSPKGSEVKITVYNPSTIPIPNLVGELQEVAEERIEKSGFLSKVEFHTTYNRAYRTYDDKVAEQSPEAGIKKPQGSEVIITVYIHPPVPNVIGNSQQKAEEIIKKTGYLPEVEYFTGFLEKYQGQEGKVVVSQRPAAGSERYQGSSITITVYNPSIPGVVDLSQQKAEYDIEKRGFLPKVQIYSTYNKEYQGQEDKVVFQLPEADTQAPHGLEVIITVYSPPAIPNVIGKSQIEAEEIINETGYLPEVKYFSSYLEKYQGQEGKVVLQRPEADRENYRGTSITITVYNPPTLVPSVVGKTQIEAEEIVEESGYLPRVEFETSYKKEYQGQEDKVIFQSPEAETHVPHGSEVTITVYSYGPTADLEIESISYQDPLVEGEKQSFSMVVRNSGDASPEKVIPDVKPISIRVGLWYKRPGDSDWEQFIFPHTGMIEIEPGKTQTYSFQKDASRSLPSGDYLIRGIVDEHAQLNDKDVQNNSMEKEISIEPSPILLKSFPERAAWGQKILLEIETGKDLKDPEHPVSLSIKFNEMEGAIDNIGKKNWREYTLSVVVPEGATTGPISVSGYGVTGRSKDNIIIFGPPAITKISPQAAPVKSTITIEGTYFANFSVEERTAVAFTTDRSESGEKLVDVTWISKNEIRVKVPDEAMSGPLSVKTIVGSIQFSTTSETSFQVLPRITGFSPKSGYAGMQALISGTSIDLERNPRVKFNGVETEIKNISGNTLEVVVPEGASTGKIETRTDEGIALSEEDFRVIIGPTINSISPQLGPKGTIVTIKGEDLDVITGASLIYFLSGGGSGSMLIEIVGTPTREQAQLRIPITIENWGEISVNFRNRYSNRVRFGNTSIYDADLGIESIQPQFPLVEGKKQTINLIVRNYGDASPEMIRPNIPEVNIRLGLMYKRQGDTEWMIFKNIRRGLIEIEPDKSRTFSFSLDGSNSLPGGDYIFQAFVDDWEQYRDSNFQNNMLEKRITIEFDQ